ncbi:MAG: hypothetical protein JW839_03315 [Candidatus Lokiarchaeota archaeon]|nr:hypothetical protein [Candidatus Lokiarchaeota archaeon]
MKVVSFILVATGIVAAIFLGMINMPGAITMVIVMLLFGTTLYFVAWIQGLTYILLFPDRLILRDQRLLWRWRTIPLDELVDVLVSKTPLFKTLIWSYDHQITVISRHSKPYSLLGHFIVNMDNLVEKLGQEIRRRGKTRGSDALSCNTCNASAVVRRCLKCGELNCNECTDAQECLPCRMGRLLGRATSSILVSLVATAVFDCVALWIGVEIYSFELCFFTGFTTFPFGIASLLAAMTLLQACRARLHDKRAARRLLSRTLVPSIMASMLVLLKFGYYTAIVETGDPILRGMIAGEIGIAGFFFVATFFTSRFKSASRDVIVQRTWRVIVWAYFYTVIANISSPMLIYFIPGEMLYTTASIVGFSSLAVIILTNLYLAGMMRKVS